MNTGFSAPQPMAQTHDRFAAMLREERVPPLHTVLMEERLRGHLRPLGPPEGLICKSNGARATRKHWQKSVLELAGKYPGYQPGGGMREQMKYDSMPDNNAPLAEFVWKRLDHARALWSAEIDAKRTRCQFDEWLPQHVGFQTSVAPLWPDGGPGPTGGQYDKMGGQHDKWSLSFQFLRVACGLPRFAANRLGVAL